MLLDGSGLCLDWFHSNIDVAGGGHRQPISSCNECPTETGDQKLVAECVACPRSLSWSTFFFGNCLFLTNINYNGWSCQCHPLEVLLHQSIVNKRLF